MESKTAIQSTPEKLVEFISSHYEKFSNNKYKILPLGENQTLATAQSGNRLPMEQFCRKGPKCPGGQTQHESNMQPIGQQRSTIR